MSRRAALLALCLLAGCRTVVRTTARVTYGTTKLALKTAYGTVKVAGVVVKDFAYYTARAALYRKYHDSGNLDSRGVARVLHRRYPKLPSYRGAYEWPLTAGIVSSEFGPRWGRMHDGIDIAADMGVPVHASAAGRVIYAGHGLRGYGNVVILRHDAGTTTLYAHNEKLKVKVGQWVKQGQVISLLGSTGHSTGPHVHFEIRKRNVAENPRLLLAKSRF